MIQKYRDEELKYCRLNPEYFIENYVHIEDKDNVENIIQPFSLWPKQKETLQSIIKNKLNIVLKARQLGITWLVLAIAVWASISNRGYLTIALSRTEDEAKELVRRFGVILKHMPELIRDSKETGWEGIRYEALTLEARIIFPNGQVSTFKAFPSASGAGRSFTANLLIIDEWAFQSNARAIWLSAYPTINRPTGGKVIGLSTIERGSLFEELFVEENNFNKIFLPWDTDPRRTMDWYLATEKDLGCLIKQEYPATIDEALTIPGGAYFPEVKKSVHVVPYQLTEFSSRYISLDYGLDKFAVLFYEINSKGKAKVYKQIYESDLIVSQAAKLLKEKCGNQKFDAYYAPPDLWNRNRDTGYSTAETFSRYGIPLTKVSNSKEQGCLNMKEWLQPFDEVNEQTGETSVTAMLTICEGAAPDLERCLTKIQKDKHNAKIYANDPHELTHITDALRYFATGRPRPPKAEEKKKNINFSFEKPKRNPSGYGEKRRVI